MAAGAAIAFVLSATPSDAGAAGRESVIVTRVTYGGLQADIATFHAGVGFRLQPEQARHSVTSLAPVAHNCRPCVVAVNADYFNPRTGEPIGGVIIGGVVLRSPNGRQNQLTISPNGQISAGIMGWGSELTAGDGTILPLAVNDPAADTPVLYDSHFGAATPSRSAIEMAFSQPRSVPLLLRKTLRFRFAGLHSPGEPIRAGQVVVSASGPSAVAFSQLRHKLWSKQINPWITVRMTTDPVAKNSLGANHILLSGGQVVPIGENDSFVNGANPRTLFGWDSRAKITLVTIGSSIPGRRAGVSLPVAARILAGLGVQNAVNLDGGGSSTFVGHGRVLNNPSDGRPRAVANAWVVRIARR